MSAPNFCKIHVCVICTLTVTTFSRIKLFSQKYSSKNSHLQQEIITFNLKLSWYVPAWSADVESRFLSWSAWELFFPNWRTCWTVTGMSVLVGINVKAAVWSAWRILALSRATSLFCAIFEQSGHWQLRNGQAECTATLKLWALHLLQNLFMLHVSNGSDIMNFLARDNFFWADQKKSCRNGKPKIVKVNVNLARHFTHAR